MNKKKINAGFAILNVIMGVILFLSSFIMYSDKDIGAGIAFFVTVLGLLLLIIGWFALYYRRKSKENQDLDVRGIKLTNTISFVLSVLILATVIILPVLASTGII